MTIKRFFPFLSAALLLAGILGPSGVSAQAHPGVTFRSSDKQLEQTFRWASRMALSYAHDGAEDPVGAQILGLSKHNKNMFTRFAENISETREFHRGKGVPFLLWFDVIRRPERVRAAVEDILAQDWNVENLSALPRAFVMQAGAASSHAADSIFPNGNASSRAADFIFPNGNASSRAADFIFPNGNASSRAADFIFPNGNASSRATDSIFPNGNASSRATDFIFPNA